MEIKNILHYKITRSIGEGGMASVYEGVHTKLDTRVAIKILDPVLAKRNNIKQRFENEAKIMASLKHPNIVHVIDYDDTGDTMAIVMELLEGQDLSDIIKGNGPIEPKRINAYFTGVLDAFAFAHSKGVVHRDVKPSNIFINKEGIPKILDFGIAKLVESDAHLTSTGTQMGTPVYMSPEQVNDSKYIDHRSDIYSLGVSLYFMLQGLPPYDTNTMSQFDIFKCIDSEPLPPIEKYPQYNAIVQKATAKDPDQRFQSCQELKEAFLNPEEFMKREGANFVAPMDDDKTMIGEAPASMTPPSSKPKNKSSKRKPVSNASNVSEAPEGKKGLSKTVIMGAAGAAIVIALAGGYFLTGNATPESPNSQETPTEEVAKKEEPAKKGTGQKNSSTSSTSKKSSSNGTGKKSSTKKPTGKKSVSIASKIKASKKLYASDISKTNKYYLVLASGKFAGFMDPGGHLLFKGKFKKAHDFSEGLAPASDGNKWGFINRKGQFVIKPKYDDVCHFSGGLAAVKIDGSTVIFVDKRGNKIFPFEFTYRYSLNDQFLFKSNLCPVVSDGDWKYLNTEGELLDNAFDKAEPFEKGSAFVKGDGGWYLVNSNLTKISATVKAHDPFFEGWARVKTTSGTYNFVSRKGKNLFSSGYSDASPFYDGYAFVLDRKGWVVANQMGDVTSDNKVVIPTGFYNGTAFVGTDRKVNDSRIFRFIDNKGNYTSKKMLFGTEAAYLGEGIWSFKDKSGKRMLLNKDGQEVGQFTKLKGAYPFEKGFAIVVDGGQNKLINKAGKVVFSGVSLP